MFVQSSSFVSKLSRALDVDENRQFVQIAGLLAAID